MATTKKFRVKHGLDAGNNTISFVNDPVSANDAATKNYVDIQVGLAPGDVSNSYLTSTFTTNTAFQSYVANTNTRIDTLEAGGTLVTNAYLTSTFTTNTDFQSFVANTNAYIATVEGDLNTQEAKQASDLANTNAYIATKTDDTTVLATNTALRVLIDDRIQVANATLLIDDRMQVANVISYVDTEIAALVNSAPTTLDTLNELAAALGDDANFSTTITTNLGQKLGATATVTLTGDVTGSGSFSSNAVSIALTDTNLANTNAYIASVSDAQSQYLQVANVASNTSTSTATFTSGNSTITFTRDDSSTYDVNLSTFAMANTSTSTAVYTVANATLTFTRADSSTFDVVIDSASVEVSNTAPSGANEGDMWWDNASGELYIYYSNNWIEAVAQDVTPYANNGTFSSSNNTITFVRTDGSQFDVVLTGVGEVTNTYVTSTFTTNTDFQSFVANTNAYIATKTDDSTVLATNTALRTLINDRMQVANVQSYVATEIAALVNSAPTTLDTLDELASALGDDANFSTTVLTLIGTKASNTVFQSALANTNSYIATKTDDSAVLATNTALRTLISDRVQVANLNTTLADYWPSANVINYTAKYLEVANVESSSISVSNTAPSGAEEGNLWWDNSTGELYVYYSNNWVEAVAQDVTPYANNGTFSSSNNTITFVRTDGSQFDVVLTGVGEVTNAYVTSTFTTNTVFQSALANTNAYIATKTDDTTVLATNTALRTLIDDRMQVANVQSYVATEIAALVNSAPTTLDTLDELASALGDDANFSTTVLTLIGTKASNSTLTSTYVTNTVFQSALANTNAYIVTKTDDTVALATNTALRTLIDDRVQVANLNTTLADYWPSANIITYTAKYLEVANSSTGTSVTVSNSAPMITANGELWWDNATGELYVAYSNNWVEAVAQDVTPYTNNASYTSGNTTLTFVRTDGSQYEATIDLSGVGEVSNSYLTSTYVTNTDFQSYVANTNPRFAQYLEVANANFATESYVDTSIAALVNSAPTTLNTLDELATALGDDANFSTTVLTLIGTKASNATLTSTYVTNTVFQSVLANTNAYIATKTDDTTVLATNTALRTLIDDRVQVANLNTTLADYWPSANIITYTAKYLEVANSVSGATLEVGNTSPSSPTEGDLWYDTDTGIINIYIGTSWVESTVNFPDFEVSNSYITSTYVSNTAFQSFVANTNAAIASSQGEVSNAYLTSTFTTNTVFQSALANTNLAISDRMQVANVQSYVATELAALVNSAPTTLDTLDELASALGDDANFSTTVLTLIGTKASNSALTSTYVTNTVFQSALANTNLAIADRMQVANVIAYTAKYLEVANNTGGASVTVQNTAPTITSNGDLWWDNSDGELYVAYANNWVEAVAQDVTPYTNNASYTTGNTTLTFVRTDGSQYEVYLDLSGVSGEVSNSYITSTYVTNTVFQSALANTNAYIATKTDDTTVLATNTALRTLIDDRMQVANVEAYLANTNSYIATESARIDLVNTNLTGTNTALRTLISDRIQVANAETRFLRKDGTASQSVGGQVTFSDNVIISGNLTVSGTRTEVNTEQLNVSNTYILLNSDLGSGTAATENAGLIVNRGSEANVYFRWNETNEYWEYGEADGTFTSVKEATTTIIDARNESGSTIDAGTPVYVSGYNGGGARPLVEPADADDPTKMPALGLALETATTGNNIRVASYGVFTNANTGVFSEGQELYVDTIAGKITGTRPIGSSAKIQKIGNVLRSHATAGTILIQGAGRSNDIPNLPNLTVFIGNTSGVGTTRQLQSTDLSDVASLVSNTYLQTVIPANTSTTSASLSGNTATFTRADSSTFTLDLSGIASAGGGGASVTVANTAPSSPTEGDLYFDNELATMFIYYDSSWVEVQPSIDPINPLTYGIDTFTANGTATDFTHTSDTVSADAMLVTVDGIIQRPTTDYTVSSKTVTFGTAPSNTSIVAVRVTTGAFTGVSNATFQSALANTNAYIASVAPSYLEVTSNTTMSAGTKYIVGTRTANVVLTFPTSASLGDEIRIIDGTGQADTFGIQLSRNGHRIQGETANLIIDTPRAAGGYVYFNANNGWILTEV